MVISKVSCKNIFSHKLLVNALKCPENACDFQSAICFLKKCFHITTKKLAKAPLVSILDLTFAWVFNEYTYFVQQDNRRFVSQETGNLYIAKVEPSDVGNYTCIVMNRVTRERVSSSPTLLVLRTDGKQAWQRPAGCGLLDSEQIRF